MCLLRNTTNEIVKLPIIAALLPPFHPSLTVTSREDLGERDVRRLGTAAGLSFFMGPLHATIEEFAADGFTHIEANRPRGRVIRLRTIDRNLDRAYARCVGAPVGMCQVRRPLLSVKPWRQSETSGTRVLTSDQVRNRSAWPVRI